MPQYRAELRMLVGRESDGSEIWVNPGDVVDQAQDWDHRILDSYIRNKRITEISREEADELRERTKQLREERESLHREAELRRAEKAAKEAEETAKGKSRAVAALKERRGA